jgi:hypothetical protein
LYICNFDCIIHTSLFVYLIIFNFCIFFWLPFLLCFLSQKVVVFLCTFLWSLVTRLRAGRSVFNILAGAGDFSFKCPHGLWGTPIFRTKRNRGTLSLELKLPRCEVHHPPLCGAQIKEECSFSCAFPIWPHGVYRNNFVFLFDLLYFFSFCLS